MINKTIKNIAIAAISLAYITSANLSALAFTDVNPGDKYYLGITYLEQEGILKGYEDGSFHPNNSIEKSEALAIIMKAILNDEDIEKEIDKKPFKDVEIDSWYAIYANKAKELGIINGNQEGVLEPNKFINLAETIKILLKSDQPEKTYENNYSFMFLDTPDTEWFTPYTSSAAAKTLINVYSSDTVNPGQEMSRAYTAEILYRLLKSKEGFEFGKATYYGKAVQGHSTASGEIFDYNLMTAAHKTLPFGTIVRVTNTSNEKSVDVKINDRGPYGPGRIIDLSSGAFAEIASLGAGIVNVQYEIISTP